VKLVRRKVAKNGYDSVASDPVSSKPDIPYYEKTLESVNYPSLLKKIKRSEILVTIGTVLQTLNYTALVSWRLFDVFNGNSVAISVYEWIRCVSLLIGWVIIFHPPVVYVSFADVAPLTSSFTDICSSSHPLKIWEQASIP
jgi:hypothetical protein